MKNNKVALGCGITFGVLFAAISYIYVILGIAFAFSGYEFMASSYIVFAVLAVTTIVTSSFAIRNPIVSRVGLTTAVVFSTVAHAFSIVQFILLDAINSSSLLCFAAMAVSLILGIIAMVNAYKAKPQLKQVKNPNQPASE